MSKLTQRELREMRKKTLLLQSEAYRLQLAQDWNTLSAPFQKGKAARGILKAFSGPAGFVDVATVLLARGRFTWIAKVLPLALTGWRIAKLARQWMRK
ncbi:hypothetical protein [Amantichitinum ursilacus]|uniref:YqjK-like protein n=1 Tax=Amantichitinum ursilacus TaxID=857265 RepID=A0A0N0XHZ4_9NEIS|nr:hypothetical protein [Amantichitinum ursilacus]KPC49141.1 hypothetical protein WG78_21515 [Amantichitinum ursilacus]